MWRVLIYSPTQAARWEYSVESEEAEVLFTDKGKVSLLQMAVPIGAHWRWCQGSSLPARNAANKGFLVTTKERIYCMENCKACKRILAMWTDNISWKSTPILKISRRFLCSHSGMNFNIFLIFSQHDFIK